MKLTKSEYSKITGISMAEVEHLGKKFRGYAKIHPDDKDKESNFFGCGLAHKRATLKALRYELSLRKKNTDEVRNFVKACECYKNWDNESPVAKVVYRQRNRRIKQVNDLIDNINDLLNDTAKNSQRRDIILNALAAKKSK